MSEHLADEILHPCCVDAHEFVNDEHMDAVRGKYEVMDLMLKNVGYDGKQIQHEIRQAFAEMRAHRAAVACTLPCLDAAPSSIPTTREER